MKQLYKYIAILIISLFYIPLQAKEINVEKAGTLPSLIGDEKLTVEDLTLSGTLNGTDIRCIRQMKMLRTLDMTECKIAEGGAYYYRVTTYPEHDCYTKNDTIGEYMFINQDSLRSVRLPMSIKSIEQYSFSDCDSLHNVTLQEGIKSIGNYAFQNAGLQVISIPASTDSISKTALLNSPLLTAFMVHNDNVTYCSEDGVLYSKDKKKLLNYPQSKELPAELTLPDYIEVIEDRVFQGRKTLNKVIVGNKTVAIGEKAFSDCISLTEVILPESLKKIGDAAFYGCYGLANINFPKCLEYIGIEAFYYCGKLTKAHLPEKITQLKNSTFCHSGLVDVILPSHLEIIEEDAFWDCKIVSIILPKSLKEIKNSAFGNNKLQSIIIPPEIKCISGGSFAQNNLSEILLPEGLISIESRSFEANPLQIIQIPASVKSIEYDTFGYINTILAEIHFSGTVPPSITRLLSSGNPTLYIPAGFNQEYIAHSIWGQYTIKEESVINQTSRSIEVCSLTPGDAATLLNGKSTTNLIVSGNINGSDIKAIRNILTIKDLDLSRANLLEGGEAYLEGRNTVNNTLGENMFSSLTDLTSIKLPKKTIAIATSAFDDCNKLTSIQAYNITPVNIDANTFKDIDKQTCRLVIPVLGKTAYGTATGWKDFATVYVSAHSEEDGLLMAELSEEEAPNIKGLVLSGMIGKTDLPILQKLENAEYIDMSDCEFVRINYGYNSDYIDETVLPASGNLIELILPKSVTNMSQTAFSNQKGLMDLTLPTDLSSIYLNVSPCVNLQNIYVPEESACYTSINGVLFSKDKKSIERYPIGRNNIEYNIPEGVTNIGDYAFSGCKSLTSINIPQGVTQIGHCSFENCTNLSQVSLPEGLDIIGAGCFYSCFPLQSINIPSTVTRIGGDDDARGAFGYCLNLRFLQLPEGLTYIGERAFSYCFLLRSINIPSTVNKMPENIFYFSNLSSLIWKTPMDIPDYLGKSENQHFLLYNVSGAKVPEDWKDKYQINNQNLIDSIGLKSSGNDYHNYNFYAALPFKTKTITYQRDFSMQSGFNTSAGWTSIALPFDVQRFTHEEKGELAPFGSDVPGAKHFWLCELTADGYKPVSKMEANKPYIISMPNNNAYPDDKNITGTVTFLAESEEGVEIAATPDILPAVETNTFKLVPAYEPVAAHDSVYAINESTYEGNLAGSIFVKNSREVYPFEAYVVSKESPALAPRMYSIGGNDGGSITGLEEIIRHQEETLRIYTRGEVLHIDCDKSRTISIYDCDGRTVRIVEACKGSNTVNGLAKGIYFLEGRKVLIK